MGGFSTGLAKPKSVLDYVDPFIVTGGHGHTHPSAVAPHGMIQAGPDTRISGWDSASGYYFGDPSIVGFTHSHLSGTGAIDRLDLLIMPTVGRAKFRRGPEEKTKKGYRSAYKNEVARPGFYSVELLDDGIDVKIAATTRSAIHQYDFSKDGDRRLTIDLQHRWDTFVRDSEIKALSPTRIVGLRRTWSWAKNQKIFFCMSFSEPVVDESNRIRLMSFDNIKSSLNFGPDIDQLKVKVALSPVDQEGACNNLDQEIPNWDLEQLSAKTAKHWENLLGRVTVSDVDDKLGLEKKKIYYTALYHSLLAPNIYQDVDGRYRGMDDKVYSGPQGSYFTIYSLWDTFRALHPFLNIFMPTTNGQMVQGLLEKYRTFGRMPEWELENHDTRVMIGYHGASVIADAWSKGIRNFDADLALEAMMSSAMENKKELKDYTANGYVPHNYKSRGYRESVSMTLEYAYDDWTIAQFIKSIQEETNSSSLSSDLFQDIDDPYTYFMERGQNYRNLFDDETGFFRPRYRSGKFLPSFDPKFISHRQNGFTEANAWQYLWFVPHDIPGLVDLLGGKDKFNEKLEELFTSEPTGKAPDVTGLIGQYAHGNEPGHHVPYLFNYTGRPSRTQYWVRRLMKDMYRAQADGLAGNEDCGQMSAWYLMSAMGIYSVTPGQDEYQLGSPIFKDIKINLENGKTLQVIAHDNSEKNIYVQKILLDGQELKSHSIRHREIRNGARLEFFMGAFPKDHLGD